MHLILHPTLLTWMHSPQPLIRVIGKALLTERT